MFSGRAGQESRAGLHGLFSVGRLQFAQERVGESVYAYPGTAERSTDTGVCEGLRCAHDRTGTHYNITKMSRMWQYNFLE